jgi:hypothetical protein
MPGFWPIDASHNGKFFNERTVLLCHAAYKRWMSRAKEGQAGLNFVAQLMALRIMAVSLLYQKTYNASYAAT